MAQQLALRAAGVHIQPVESRFCEGVSAASQPPAMYPYDSSHLWSGYRPAVVELHASPLDDEDVGSEIQPLLVVASVLLRFPSAAAAVSPAKYFKGSKRVVNYSRRNTSFLSSFFHLLTSSCDV